MIIIIICMSIISIIIIIIMIVVKTPTHHRFPCQCEYHRTRKTMIAGRKDSGTTASKQVSVARDRTSSIS